MSHKGKVPWCAVTVLLWFTEKVKGYAPVRTNYTTRIYRLSFIFTFFSFLFSFLASFNFKSQVGCISLKLDEDRLVHQRNQWIHSEHMHCDPSETFDHWSWSERTWITDPGPDHLTKHTLGNYRWIPREGGLRLTFFGYVPLASQSPYSIRVYAVANYRLHLSHFWANN